MLKLLGRHQHLTVQCLVTNVIDVTVRSVLRSQVSIKDFTNNYQTQSDSHVSQIHMAFHKSMAAAGRNDSFAPSNGRRRHRPARRRLPMPALVESSSEIPYYYSFACIYPKNFSACGGL